MGTDIDDTEDFNDEGEENIDDGVGVGLQAIADGEENKVDLGLAEELKVTVEDERAEGLWEEKNDDLEDWEGAAAGDEEG